MKPRDTLRKSIFIAGATSGIGKSVAFEFAKKGHNLALTGRRFDKLVEIKEKLHNKYPNIKIEIRELDVTNYPLIEKIFKDCCTDLGGIDIVFANAGINLPEKIGCGQFDNAKKIIETNLIGAIATIEVAAAYFLKVGKGHIVATGSIAAFRGLPGNPSYSVSKAGLNTYLEAVRAELHGKNIFVTILNPGYVDTDINKNEKKRPFVISSQKGAQIIYRLIEKKSKSSSVPLFPWIIYGFLAKFFPTWLIAKISKKERINNLE